MPIDRSLLETMIAQGLTPDQRSQLTLKEDGTVDFRVKPFAEPKGGKKTPEGGKPTSDLGDNIPKEGGEISQTALAQYLKPYAGPAASSLRGLMPEQVMAVINAQRAAEEARRGTIGQLMQAPLRQAQVEELRARIAAAQAPPAPPTELEEARTAQARAAAGLAEKRAEVLGPAAPPLTFAQRMQLKKTAAEIPRGTWWRNPTTDDIAYVEKGDDPEPGYTDMVTAERAPSALALKKEARLTAQQVANMGDKIGATPEFEGNRGLIPFFNEYTTGNTGYIWTPKIERWMRRDIAATAIRVDLPLKRDGTQATMDDVREDALARGVSVDLVLSEIYEAMEAAK